MHTTIHLLSSNHVDLSQSTQITNCGKTVQTENKCLGTVLWEDPRVCLECLAIERKQPCGVKCNTFYEWIE